jgi:GNAT superfamily N-acetyltransferase
MSDGSPAPLQWRLMSASDLPAVHELSARVHPDFPERPEVLAEKFRLFPRGCFVLDGSDAGLAGYCFSHPWEAGSPPALDTMIGTLPGTPEVYFIHDLALDKSARGRNFGSQLMPRVIENARDLGLGRIALVAVSGSEPFWARMGFRRTDSEKLQAAARAKYGDAAAHMERDLAV